MGVNTSFGDLNICATISFENLAGILNLESRKALLP